MPESHISALNIDRALASAAHARARAVRAVLVAARHERLAAMGDSPLREMHLDMAEMHRSIERRQLAAARMHAGYAGRLTAWASGGITAVPRFMTAVATEVGAGHVGISLVLGDRTEAVAVASDPVVSAAQDAEYALGEGPLHDVMAAGAPLLVDAPALAPRWPRLAPQVARLGVTTVAAVPLRTNTAFLGALTVLNPPVDLCRSAETLSTVADALVHSTILTPDSADPLDLPLLADCDNHALVHQATGMVAERLGCGAVDALAVLRARAFAEDEPLDAVAADVVCRGLRLS